VKTGFNYGQRISCKDAGQHGATVKWKAVSVGGHMSTWSDCDVKG